MVLNPQCGKTIRKTKKNRQCRASAIDNSTISVDHPKKPSSSTPQAATAHSPPAKPATPRIKSLQSLDSTPYRFKNPESFLKFFAWLSFASPQQLGHGERLDIINGVEFKCNWKKFAQRVRPEALDSRGTTIWNAWEPVKLEEDLAGLGLSDKPQTEPQMILKMQWHKQRKTTEAEFLEEIDGMLGVQKLYGA